MDICKAKEDGFQVVIVRKNDNNKYEEKSKGVIPILVKLGFFKVDNEYIKLAITA